MSKVIKIQVGATLKLTNVLQVKISLNELMNMREQHKHMTDYIKASGFLPIGPAIHKSVLSFNKYSQPEMTAYLLQQLDGYIEHPHSPYVMEASVLVENCLYTHFVGNSSDIGYAYDKMNLVAYEHEFTLSNESYTVMIDEDGDNIVADIFMEQIKCK